MGVSGLKRDVRYVSRRWSVSPVIVGRNDRATRVMHFENWIRQRIGDSKSGERRTDRSNDHRSSHRSVPAYNETTDQNMLPSANKAPGANVKNLMSRGLDGEELRIVKVAGKKGALNSGRRVLQSLALVIVSDIEVIPIIDS